MTETSVLPNGLVVVTETMDQIPACHVVLRFGVGSACEPDGRRGVAHFAEHVAFKGTRERGAIETLHLIEDLGGAFNAATTADATTYFATVAAGARAHDFDAALRLMAENVLDADLSPETIDGERRVISEELADRAQQPEVLAYEALVRGAWPGPWGEPVGGRAEDLAAIGAGDVLDWMLRYGGRNGLLSVAGNVAHAEVVGSAARHLGGMGRSDDARPPLPAYGPFERTLAHGRERAHVVAGFPCPRGGGPAADARGGVAALLFGGTQTSRLWLTLRERRNLVYDVGLDAMRVPGAEMLLVFLACRPENVDEVLDALQQEADALAGGAADAAAIAREVARHVRRRDLAASSVGYFASRNLDSLVYHGGIRTFAEEDDAMAAVTPDDVSRWAADHLRRDLRSTVVVLPEG